MTIGNPMPSPTPKMVLEARLAAGHTQKQSAEVVGSHRYQTWQRWELGEVSMPQAKYEYYLIKTGQKERPTD